MSVIIGVSGTFSAQWMQTRSGHQKGKSPHTLSNPVKNSIGSLLLKKKTEMWRMENVLDRKKSSSMASTLEELLLS